MDLDIHLDCSDSVVGTSYLKVHVAEEVFETLDIGQYQIIIIGLACYQTAGDTCNRFFDRYTGSHQRHGGCTDTCLRSRTVGLESLGYGTDCVRELLLGRKHRNKGTFCQSSMADLTASRSAGWFRLAYRVGREVVLMHVTFGGLELIQSVQFLCFGKRSQCCYVADLSLSTGKHSGTMNTRDNVNLCCQRTDFCDRTAVRTFVVF